MALTEQNKKFNYARAEGHNNTQAAKIAGYAEHKVTGCKTAKNPVVKAHFDEITKQIINKKIATAQDRQEFWTNVMNNDSSVREPVLNEKGEPAIDFITGERTTYPLKMVDRIKAAELLGKAQQDFIERREITGVDGEAIRFKHVTDNDLDLLLHEALDNNVIEHESNDDVTE